MSYNLNPVLKPAYLLDSTCWSGEAFERRPVPSAFDSEDFINLQRETSLSSPDIDHPLADPVAPNEATHPPHNSPVAPTIPAQQPALTSLVVRKPPMPALPRGLNITAYTKPEFYSSYIRRELTPSTANAARSSLTTISDSSALAHVRENNGRQFLELISNEMKSRLSNAPSNWITDTLFPSRALPIDFAARFRSSLLWDANNEKWSSQPLDYTEPAMRNWLNWIVHSFGNLFKLFNKKGHPKSPYCDRSWDDRTANSGPTGGSWYRKPDISLLSRKARSSLKKDERPGWPVIEAFAEVTRSQRSFEAILRNITEKAYLMFESQPFRRYVLALAFFGPEVNRRWALVVVDRAGVVSSPTYSLNGADGATLARALFALSFAAPRYVGVDETMSINPSTGAVTQITVTGQTPTLKPGRTIRRDFAVVRLLHTTSCMSGRATRVWLVSRKGRHYILKDSWPLKNQPFCEIRHLLWINQSILSNNDAKERLKHTYPVLNIGQELGDSTSDRRAGMIDKPPERVHRRMVTKPIGDPITSFRNKYELCAVLFDIVNFLKYASEVCKICHGDISIYNVVINRVWDGDVDLDHCDDDDDNDGSNTADSDSERENDDDDDDGDYIDNSTGGNIGSRNTTRSLDAANARPQLTNPSLERAGDDKTSKATESDMNLGNPSTPSKRPTVTSPDQPAIRSYGLAIDNDNSFSLDEAAKYHYRVNSGTLPYMALDALKWEKPTEFSHQPKHDLESLFHVILTICTYVTGPCTLRTPIPAEKSVCLNEWWAVSDRHRLARTKAGILSAFDDYVLNRLPPYWGDFQDILKDLHSAIWPKECSVLKQPNVATHDRFLSILLRAMDRFEPEANLQFHPFAHISPSPQPPGSYKGQKRVHDGHDDQAVDVGELQRKKTRQTETNNHGTTFLPHRLDQQPFAEYVDSGIPIVTPQ